VATTTAANPPTPPRFDDRDPQHERCGCAAVDEKSANAAGNDRAAAEQEGHQSRTVRRTIAGTHVVAHLLAAGTHSVITKRGETAQTTRLSVHPSRQSFGTARRIRCPSSGRGSHLGSTLNPGKAVLTRGVSRRSGSVACIRADASPTEVLTHAS